MLNILLAAAVAAAPTPQVTANQIQTHINNVSQACAAIIVDKLKNGDKSTAFADITTNLTSDEKVQFSIECSIFSNGASFGYLVKTEELKQDQ